MNTGDKVGYESKRQMQAEFAETRIKIFYKYILKILFNQKKKDWLIAWFTPCDFYFLSLVVLVSQFFFNLFCFFSCVDTA